MTMKVGTLDDTFFGLIWCQLTRVELKEEPLIKFVFWCVVVVVVMPLAG